MLRGRLWTALVLDAESNNRCHQTTLNGVVGDPIGRLLREAARGLGHARPEDVELRYIPRRSAAGLRGRFRAAWDVAVEVNPGAFEWTQPLDPLTFAVRRRTAQPGCASGRSATAAPPLPPPPPQSVHALTPDGAIYGASFSLAATDPLADLSRSPTWHSSATMTALSCAPWPARCRGPPRHVAGCRRTWWATCGNMACRCFPTACRHPGRR
jgi:hypothetical protein